MKLLVLSVLSRKRSTEGVDVDHSREDGGELPKILEKRSFRRIEKVGSGE